MRGIRNGERHQYRLFWRDFNVYVMDRPTNQQICMTSYICERMRKKCTMSNSSYRILPTRKMSQGGNWMANGSQCPYVECQNELVNGKWPLELEKLMTYALAHGVKIKIFRLQFRTRDWNWVKKLGFWL